MTTHATRKTPPRVNCGHCGGTGKRQVGPLATAIWETIRRSRVALTMGAIVERIGSDKATRGGVHNSINALIRAGAIKRHPAEVGDPGSTYRIARTRAP